MSRSETTIAIVGGGPAGMAALKELRGLGFNVTLFERRHELGGIWTWTEDRSVTTALKETKLCNSKFGLTLSDFPIPSNYPPFIAAPQLGAYLQSYAKNFDLYKNTEFGKSVTGLERNARTSKWDLTFADQPSAPKSFDKVIWATGGFLRPRTIELEGKEQFDGRIIHSQDVRNLADFQDKNVMVLGIGNTAADVTIGLVPHAKKVYMAHRRGTKIFGRTQGNGLPFDSMLTHTICSVMWWIEAHFPSIFGYLMDSAMDDNFKGNWGENKPEWGFAQSPSIKDGVHIVVCSDDLIPLVKEGKVTSLHGIKRVVGPKAVEMSDGAIVDDADAIIACIGYTDDMELLSEALTFVDAPGEAAPLPNLYMGIFPPDYSESIAIISNVHLNGQPQIPGRELAAMAVAQIWAGNSTLPSKPTMNAWIEKHQRWLRARITQAPGGYRGEVLQSQWMYFVHDMAGTGMFDHLGWSWKAWKLWLSDRKFYNALAHGPYNSYGFRVFETGKRAVWSGARQAVLDAKMEVDRVAKAVKLKRMK